MAADEVPSFESNGASVAPKDSDRPVVPWHQRKIQQERQWIAKRGGAQTEKGALEPSAYPALAKMKLIEVAFDRDVKMTGAVRVYLALQSYDNPNKDIYPSIAALQRLTMLSYKATANGLQRLKQLGILEIENRKNPKNRHRFTSSFYTFIEGTGTVAEQVLRIATQGSTGNSRCGAEMSVIAFIACKMILRQAKVSFTAAELMVGTGLSRKHAVRAIETLLAKRVIVKVGEGTAAFPEALAGSLAVEVPGRFWTKRKRKRGRKATQ